MGLAASATGRGGQLVAQGPLQTDLPLLGVSRSKVYSVMPVGPISTPSAVRVGVSGADDMLPQPASRAAARIEALSSFMKFSPSVEKKAVRDCSLSIGFFELTIDRGGKREQGVSRERAGQGIT